LNRFLTHILPQLNPENASSNCETNLFFSHLQTPAEPFHSSFLLHLFVRGQSFVRTLHLQKRGLTFLPFLQRTLLFVASYRQTHLFLGASNTLPVLHFFVTTGFGLGVGVSGSGSVTGGYGRGAGVGGGLGLDPGCQPRIAVHFISLKLNFSPSGQKIGTQRLSRGEKKRSSLHTQATSSSSQYMNSGQLIGIHLVCFGDHFSSLRQSILTQPSSRLLKKYPLLQSHLRLALFH